MPSRHMGLVGCVKEKAGSPRPAKDLYVSTLFSGRRSFVERSCEQWWILFRRSTGSCIPTASSLPTTSR